MNQFTTDQTDAEARNIIDRAANSADRLLEATRHSAGKAIDTVADKVHAARDKVSPAMDRLTAPIDSLSDRTRSAPLQSLLLAAAAGAVLMALVGVARAPR